MAIEAWELVQRQRGNLESADKLRSFRKLFGDFHFNVQRYNPQYRNLFGLRLAPYRVQDFLDAFVKSNNPLGRGNRGIDMSEDPSREMVGLMAAYYNTKATPARVADAFSLPSAREVTQKIKSYFGTLWRVLPPPEQRKFAEFGGNPRVAKRKERRVKTEEAINREVIRRLNAHFREGGSVWDESVIEDLRRFPRPVLVDLEHTLTAPIDDGEVTVNPNSRRLLRQLDDMGTVFIVSLAPGWQRGQEVLSGNRLWNQRRVLMMGENISPQPDNPFFQEQVRRYIGMMRALGKDYPEEAFELQNKRLSPLFGRLYEIPLIDDLPANCIDNPGVKGIIVKGFIVNPERDWELLYSGRHGVSLDQAGTQVREHYTDPFEGKLVESEYDSPYLFSLKGNPDIVIRDETEKVIDVPDYFTKKIAFLNKLRNKYGLRVVRFKPVISQSRKNNFPNYYLVTEKIKGPNLKEKTYTTEEIITAVPKLDLAYKTLAQYLMDFYRNGGWIKGDITTGRLENNGNEQYVYGRRSGEEEDNIFFVDIGSMVSRYTDRDLINESVFGRLLPGLVSMVLETEGKLSGRKLEQARATIIDFINAIPEEAVKDMERFKEAKASLIP